MSWDKERYESVKIKAQSDLTRKLKSPYDYMQIYKQMIADDDFEGAKAVTEVLKPLNYDTADTHNHIPCLKEPVSKEKMKSR